MNNITFLLLYNWFIREFLLATKPLRTDCQTLHMECWGILHHMVIIHLNSEEVLAGNACKAENMAIKPPKNQDGIIAGYYY